MRTIKEVRLGVFMCWRVLTVVRTPQEKDLLGLFIPAEDMVFILIYVTFQGVYHYKINSFADSFCDALITPMMMYEGYTS
jgi:hypothetical protein